MITWASVLRFLTSIDAIEWALMAYLLAVIFIIWQLQRQEGNGFEIADFFKDHGTSKASNAALLSFLFGGIGIWETIATTLRGDDATTLVLGMLGLTLGYRGAESWARRPVAPPAPPAQGDNIAQQVVIPSEATAAPKPTTTASPRLPSTVKGPQ